MEGPLFEFIILHHTGWISGERGDHWDWMLQSPEPHSKGLISFASTADPRSGWLVDPLDSLAPHREAYLNYEGPVSQNRGEVKRVAKGRIRWIEFLARELSFELVDMDFLQPPFTPWPSGRYCLARDAELPTAQWRLTRED